MLKGFFFLFFSLFMFWRTNKHPKEKGTALDTDFRGIIVGILSLGLAIVSFLGKW